MAAQTENRFCYSCGEYLEGSVRFCVKCGCRKKLLDDSTSGKKKSKSLNEYVKEIVNFEHVNASSRPKLSSAKLNIL